MGQLAFDFNQFDREQAPVRIVGSYLHFPIVDATVLVQLILEACALLFIHQQFWNEQRVDVRALAEAFAQSVVDEVHLTRFGIHQRDLAGAGVEDEDQQGFGFGQLPGTPFYPLFQLGVEGAEIIRKALEQALVPDQLDHQHADTTEKCQQQPIDQGEAPVEVNALLIERLRGTQMDRQYDLTELPR